jgi:hypothetical protein
MGPNLLIQLAIFCTCCPAAQEYSIAQRQKMAKLNTHCNIYTLVHQTMDSLQRTYSINRMFMVNDQHNFLLTHDKFFKLSMHIGYQVPNNMDFFSTMYVILNLLKEKSI